jgi:hypothetical protein
MLRKGIQIIKKKSIYKGKSQASQVPMSELPPGTPVLTDKVPFSNLQGPGPASQDASIKDIISLTAPYIDSQLDGNTPQLTDKFPVLRNGSWKNLTYQEVIANFNSSLSPFDAIVDTVGTAPHHYVNESAAIAAGASVIYTVGGTLNNFLNFIEPESNIVNLKTKIDKNLKKGALCLVSDSKEYHYWDGSNWLSPENAGELHPFSKANDNSIINVNRNIFIYRGGSAYHLCNQQGFNIASNCTLTIYSPGLFNNSSYFQSGSTLLTNNPVGTTFFSGDGAVSIQGIYLVQGGGSLFASTLKVMAKNCQAKTMGTNNQYFNPKKFGSTIKSIFVYGQTIAGAVDNSVVIGDGCVGEDVEYFNSTGSTGTHITIEQGGKLCRVKGSGQPGAGGFPFVIYNYGELQGIETSYPISPVIINDGGTISNSTIATASGFAPVTASLTNTNSINISSGNSINNVKFDGASITVDSAAFNTTFFECNTFGGTYSNEGKNTLGYANNGGLLPNSVPFFAVADAAARLALTSKDVGNGQIVVQKSDYTAWVANVDGQTVGWSPIGSVPGTSISPYQAALDGKGTLPNFYATINAAYTALKSYLYTIASTSEVTNTTMKPADQLAILIGQNFVSDLKNYQIIGSYNPSAVPPVPGGNAITIRMEDASSTLKFGYSSSLTPFANLDAQSTLVILGNGGTVINTSTVANTSITCDGRLICKDSLFILPNASNGGITTNSYSQLSGLKFTGGGATCDIALTCNGGSVKDIVIDGAYANNSTLIQTNVDTSYDSININVPINATVEVMGKATKIFSTNQNGFVIVRAKTSLAPNGNTGVSESNFDQLSLSPNTQRIQVSNCTIGILDLPLDNSCQVDFSNVTILNSCSLAGTLSFSNCHFPDSFTPNSGATLSFSNCTSGAAITDWNGATKRRSLSNDSNIGNDAIAGASSITQYEGEIDGGGASANHYATFNAAITAGKFKLLQTATTSLTADVTLTANTSLQLLENCYLNFNGHRILPNGFTLTINGINAFVSGIIASAANTGEVIADASTNSPALCFNDVMIDLSAVTNPNTGIGETTSLFATNSFIKVGAADNSGVTLNPGGGIDNCNPRVTNSVIQVNSTGATNTININNGIFSDNELQILNFTPANTLVKISVGCIFDSIDVTSGSGGFTIETQSNVSNVSNPSGIPINVKFLSGAYNIKAINCDLSDFGLVNFNGVAKVGIENVKCAGFSGATANDLSILHCDLSLAASSMTLSGNGAIVSNNRIGSDFTISGNNTKVSNSIFSILANNGNTTSLSNCSASSWSETGTGRLSQTCQGAIPNTEPTIDASVTVSVIGGLPIINGTKHIVGIAYLGVGHFRLNIRSGIFPDDKYVVLGGCVAASGLGINTGVSFAGGSSKTATQCEIFTFIGSSNFDPPDFGVTLRWLAPPPPPPE